MTSNEGSVLVADDSVIQKQVSAQEPGSMEKNSVMATAKNILPGNNEFSQMNVNDTTAQTSYFDSKFVSKRGGMNSESRQRAMTRSPRSRYRNIPTKNIKFEKFIELIFKSRMQNQDVKEEIVKYVQALETSYTDAIRDLKAIIDREKGKQRKQIADKVNMSTERNELESLFIECIEEVRKDIMKRRLKNEIYNRKKFQQLDKTSEEAKEFEESLLRLAQLAKNRVKVTDFTNRDKTHILDLFVNNEKTLLKIYEALFPHRTVNGVGSQQPSTAPHPNPINIIENPMQNFQNRSNLGGARSSEQINSTFNQPLNHSYNGPVGSSSMQFN